MAYALPIIMVIRCVFDFRKLNKITEVDPQVDDSRRPVLVTQWQEIPNIQNRPTGNRQIPVAPEDMHKTACMTQDVQYEFLRMPFGMVNSGGHKNVLEGFFRVGSYIDDLVIYKESWEEHIRTLKELFGRMIHSPI